MRCWPTRSRASAWTAQPETAALAAAHRGGCVAATLTAATVGKVAVVALPPPTLRRVWQSASLTLLSIIVVAVVGILAAIVVAVVAATYVSVSVFTVC